MDKYVQLLIVVVCIWLGWQLLTGVLAQRTPQASRRAHASGGELLQDGWSYRPSLSASWSQVQIPQVLSPASISGPAGASDDLSPSPPAMPDRCFISSISSGRLFFGVHSLIHEANADRRLVISFLPRQMQRSDLVFQAVKTALRGLSVNFPRQQQVCRT